VGVLLPLVIVRVRDAPFIVLCALLCVLFPLLLVDEFLRHAGHAEDVVLRGVSVCTCTGDGFHFQLVHAQRMID
jgi:hypothetical protein